ncbi:MAG: hypothetical protein MPJ78_13835 [Hyphomicrobiaceae bacterium]|nr:hypothetical protein [Hyphomicrobiaceae bacterium]
MVPKTISFSANARSELCKGIELPARAIRAAFGPNGTGTIFHRPPAAPEVLFDGFSIAREVIATDPTARLASTTLKEVLFDLDREFGDGTSALALIADEIIRGARIAIEGGYDPGSLADALLRCAAMAAAENASNSVTYCQSSHARGIAETAAMGEHQLVEIVVQLSDELGPDARIMVKEGSGREITTRILPGMSLSAGHVSPQLQVNEPGEADVYYNPYVMLVDENIDDFGKLVPVLEGFAQKDKSLVVFARGISGPALAALVVNVRENGLKASAVAVPDVSSRVFDVLRDLAVLTGAEIVGQQTGYTLDRFLPHMLGRLERIEIQGNISILVGTAPDPEKLNAHRAELRAEIERNSYLSLDKERLESRLARLGGGIGEVLIAARSAPEQKRLTILARRAVNALFVARRSGVVPGGGAAYRNAAARLADNRAETDTELVAFRLLARALATPEHTLAAGLKPANGVATLRALDKTDHPHSVLDLRSGEIVDAFQSELLEPAELVSEVILRAASMSATLIRAEVCIADLGI